MRRRGPSRAARLRPYWVILVLLLIVGAVAAISGASWQGFEPRRVDVVGNSVVSRDDILLAAGVRSDRSMWLQDTGAMAGRIQALPYIESAAVHRVPPSEVVIVVTERVPLAVAGNRLQNVIVDRKLRVLAPAGATDTLPRFVLPSDTSLDLGRTLGEPAPQLAADLDVLAAAHADVGTLELDKYGELIATMRDGMRVLFGDDADLQAKVRLLPAIEAKLARSPQPVAAIDLRAIATPVVVYK
ncbi:MAG: cell division protein FtsQ/DivIB [Vulcanimicrobiaceae bacterium]